MNNLNKWGLGFLVAGTALFFGLYTRYADASKSPTSLTTHQTKKDTLPAYTPKKHYGIVVDSLHIIQGKVKRNQNLTDLLEPYHVPYETIYTIAKQSKKVYDVKRIAPGKLYDILYKKANRLKQATHLIYHPNAIDYVVIHLEDSAHIYTARKPVVVKEKEMIGTIHTSLYVDMLASGGTADLVNKLVDVFAWQVDFFGIQKGDRYKVIYEEQHVNGTPVNTGKILAAYFEHISTPFYAFLFNQGKGDDYFDSAGVSLRREFLRAPLSFTRISSRYSGRRYHPVQKRYKAHLGTDYAAPIGTPVRAVADGKVIAAKYNRYNGNFVKIKHNGNLATQYLHLHKITSGIRYGKRVKRGQTIGYVGATGLTTGPHLCYRFWKNGRQVDALKVKLPPSAPISKTHQAAFEATRQVWQKRLAHIKEPKLDSSFAYPNRLFILTPPDKSLPFVPQTQTPSLSRFASR